MAAHHQETTKQLTLHTKMHIYCTFVRQILIIALCNNCTKILSDELESVKRQQLLLP